jgi:hypothetical protein
MSSVDFTELSDGLDLATVDNGVTAGIAAPNGGGSFVYGFNSLAVTPGAVGYFTNQVNFAPMAKGSSVRGAVSRGVSGGTANFSPFLFAGLGGTSVNDACYMLGLSDADPYHIVLKKGVLATGIVDAAPAPATNGILLRSSATDTIGSATPYRHLRLDVIVNDNGDVILQPFENDLDAQPLGVAPVWVAIPMLNEAGVAATEFIDDALQVNSGSPAYTSGRGGYGFQTADVTRRAYFDHIEIFRQL